jgi:lipopolysaccharide export LptBFGC system permease protein LptF
LVFFHVVGPHESRHWFIGSYNQQTGEMTNPHLDWDLPDHSSRSIDADHANYADGVWTFYQVREFRRTSSTNALPQMLAQTNILAFPDFSETPGMIHSEIVINDKYYHQSSTHSADIPVSQISNYLQLHPQPEPFIRPWIYTKLQGRFAGPFACLVVVLVAIPFGAASGRRNVYVGVATSILIFFTYYVVQQMGFMFGENGRVPPWLGAWLPNLFFTAGSLWMISKVR